MNEVVNRPAGGAIAALNALKHGIANVRQTLVTKSTNPFMKLGKDGIWCYGAENIEVENGSLWAVNVLSFEHGWVAWERGEDADNSDGPKGEVMYPMNMPLPDKAEMKDVGAEWKYQISCELLCLNGTDKGEQALYKANSVGGTDAMDGLTKAIGAHLEEDDTTPVPVIRLGSDSYQHKKWGKTYTPVFDIVDWVPLSDQLPTVAEPAPKAAPAAAKPRTRSVPASKAEPAPPAEQDDELAALERQLAEKKAAKAAAEQATVAVDPKAAARAKLLAELAAMDNADEGQAAQPAPAAQVEAPASGQPQRRRR